MYSLVSAAVLAQDVLRHPYAACLAEAVDRVLALTSEDLAAFGDPAPEPVRRSVLWACSAPPAASAAGPGGESGQAGERAVDVLDGTVLGSLAQLQDLLRREEPLRSAAPAARQVALDAVAVAWAGPAVALPVAAALLHPWESVLPPVGPPLGDVGGPALRDLLDQVLTRTPEQWARTAAAHAGHRRGGRWSTPMHEACRVAWAHGRLQDVARAQLSAVRALALTRTGAPAAAVAMAVTAAVQALCVADVLDDPSRKALLGAWEAGQ